MAMARKQEDGDDGKETMKINVDVDFHKLLQQEHNNITSKDLKEAMDLNPMFMLTSRLVHCMAQQILQQAHLMPGGKKRFPTKTEVKKYFDKRLRKGIRANYRYATECISDIVDTMPEEVFITKLYGNEHDEIFDVLYAKGLSVEHKDDLALAVNMVCFPPKNRLPEGYVDSESGEEMPITDSDEDKPKPTWEFDQNPGRAWFPTKELLFVGHARIARKKHERSELEREVLQEQRKKVDKELRKHTLTALKACMDAFKSAPNT